MTAATPTIRDGRDLSERMGFSGWLPGDKCEHSVPSRSEDDNPHGGMVVRLEWLGALPYALVLWPSGRMEHVMVPEYLHPLD